MRKTGICRAVLPVFILGLAACASAPPPVLDVQLKTVEFHVSPSLLEPCSAPVIKPGLTLQSEAGTVIQDLAEAFASCKAKNDGLIKSVTATSK